MKQKLFYLAAIAVVLFALFAADIDIKYAVLGVVAVGITLWFLSKIIKSNWFLSLIIFILGVGALAYFFFFVLLEQREQQLEEAEQKSKDTVLQKQTPLKTVSITEVSKKDTLTNTNIGLASFTFDDDTFWFGLDNNRFTLHHNDNIFGYFPIVAEKDIHMQEVYGSTNKFFLQLADKTYLISTIGNSLQDLAIQIPIVYVKESKDSIIVITEKGSFVQAKGQKKWNFFPLFSDFIYYKNGYIGVINSTEKQKKKNFGFEDISGTLIIWYNPTTKKRQILEKLNFSVTKLYNKKQKIIIENKDGTIFHISGV